MKNEKYREITKFFLQGTESAAAQERRRAERVR